MNISGVALIWMLVSIVWDVADRYVYSRYLAAPRGSLVRAKLYGVSKLLLWGSPILGTVVAVLVWRASGPVWGALMAFGVVVDLILVAIRPYDDEDGQNLRERVTGWVRSQVTMRRTTTA